ncbi:piggyBac transposable element-derived protein 3-like [Notolabrus celidotus]|uniref:piggyBac transposable element-derived protein 3-like n=1 Tax=Notolabrus celidotus TaxID=1203425 RepID=UPI00148F562C|nr:piggyBac transposable element-derived protein 3-like [Notolabrus celidotus]
MDKKKQYSLQDALKIITGDDSDFEGCEDSSDEDPDDPDYTPNKKEIETEESSCSSDSDSGESSDLDEQQPSVNPRQQATTVQRKEKEEKKTFSWRQKSFETPDCPFKGEDASLPDTLHTPLEYFRKFRGSVDARVEKDGKVAIVKWYDNKSVTLISSYCAIDPQDKARRWSKSDKAFVEVSRPHIVQEYNTFMGGIDLIDACVARTKYHMRSRRWYLYLFWQTIMLGLVNAWFLYRRDCKLLDVRKPLKQRNFQAEIATSLILLHSQRGRPAFDSPSPPPLPRKRVRTGVPDDVRTDHIAHWSGKCEKRGRCKLCKVNATTTFCEKCDVRLCFTEERNCFKSYHLA